MNQRDCEQILAIAREKSISKAASKLYMSQPALSLFLTRLEASLGTKLFSRGQNGLIPTYAGECYIRTAEKILKLCNDFEVELCEISALHKGRIQVGATVHLGSYVFPLLLPRYKERYPNIDILITESRSAELESALAHNELDIALMPQSYISLFTYPEEPVFCSIEDEYEAWWTFVAAYPKDSELSAPAAEMVKILKDIYKKA